MLLTSSFHPFTNATGIRVSVTDSRDEAAYTTCTVYTTALDAVKSRAVASFMWFEHAHNHFSEQYFQMLCPVKNCLHRNRSDCIPLIVCVQLPVLSNYHQHSILTYRAKFLDLMPCFCVILYTSSLFYRLSEVLQRGLCTYCLHLGSQLFGECVFVTMRWPSVILATSGITITAWTFPVRCLGTL